MNQENLLLLADYIESHSSPEPSYLQAIVRDTQQHVVNPHMLSGHIQGRLLAMFSRMLRPTRILEIGTYTGYSALCLAEGLQAEGKVVTIEKNDELEGRIRHNLSLSPLNERVELIIGSALDILPTLSASEPFDLVFIDGDKREYVAYWEAIQPLLKKEAFILADNTLWDGHICDPHYDRDQQTKGLRQFNDLVGANASIEKVILPIRDGMTLIRLTNQG